MMKNIYLAFIFLCIHTTLFAQYPGGGSRGTQSMNVVHFYGKVVDETSGKPIEASSIQLLQNKMDTATQKRRDVVVAVLPT